VPLAAAAGVWKNLLEGDGVPSEKLCEVPYNRVSEFPSDSSAFSKAANWFAMHAAAAPRLAREKRLDPRDEVV